VCIRFPTAQGRKEAPPWAAPEAKAAVHDRAVMSIEKESSGLPEMDVHKRTTKVNLSIVIGLLIFFAAMFGLVAWYWFTRS
jgi:hypothetical protein